MSFQCCKLLAYYIDWFVCPGSAVRASHSAVDLRTCTDADLILCSVCIEELVGGLLRSICFEKRVSLNQFDVLLRVRGRHYSPKSSSGACLVLLYLDLEMAAKDV